MSLRIAVVGIGGVGGYIGAKLCSLIGTQKKKYEITFIARGEHADAIRSNGLHIIEDDNEYTVMPTDVCSASEAKGEFDLILLCVKSYAIKDAVDELKKNIRTDTVIISFANGVNNADIIKQSVDAKVINGCVYILSQIDSPGVIRKRGSVFSVVFGDSDYIGESLFIEYMFKDADIKTLIPDDIDVAIWKKYIFISAFASLTSFYDMSIKRIYDEHFDETKALLEEIASVAAAKGIDIQNEVSKALKVASSLPLEASTSMHLDFQNNKPTELDTLSGYIVTEANRLHISVPIMQQIYNGLKK